MFNHYVKNLQGNLHKDQDHRIKKCNILFLYNIMSNYI